ncbi:MAG: DNA-directed RNA polymerase subunit omega [Bradymonadales bacterium]|nr:MAG: DNA-directed RNA polymerase subunit omega [Bradymonadales bacterium]
MARITVEDCLEHVDNRFELVHLASRRTRQLMKGARPLVDNTFSQNRLVVVGLREIAAGFVKSVKKLPSEA